MPVGKQTSDFVTLSTDEALAISLCLNLLALQVYDLELKMPSLWAKRQFPVDQLGYLRDALYKLGEHELWPIVHKLMHSGK